MTIATIEYEKCARYHYRATFNDGRTFNMIQDGHGLWSLYLSPRAGQLGLLRRKGFRTLANVKALLIDAAMGKVVL